MINQNYLDTHNFLIITLDSLRYDVSIKADIPNFKRWFSKYGTHDNFVKTYAPANYTLPSHIFMFVPGIFPENRELEGYYNRYSQSMIRAESAESRGKRNGINFHEPNIIAGFSANGFETIGVGGVGWFNDITPAAKYLTCMFSQFYFNESFHEKNPRAVEEQLKLIKKVVNPKEKTFLFLNVSSTHYPYCGYSFDFEGQKKALEYVDQHIDEVLSLLSQERELFAIICADHGEVFGLGGRGHGFYHPKVMEVPMMVLDTAEPRKHSYVLDLASKDDNQSPVVSLESEYYKLQEKFYQLKDQMDYLEETGKRFAELQQENQRVRENNQRLLQENQRIKEYNKQLQEENQQLKQTKAMIAAQKLKEYPFLLKLASIGCNFLARVYSFFKKK